MPECRKKVETPPGNPPWCRQMQSQLSLRKVILKSQAKCFSFFETLTLQFILHLTDIMENISIHSMTGSSPGSKIFCRICHDVDNLQKACKCRGTIALVHLTCLEKWLSYNQNSTCKLIYRICCLCFSYLIITRLSF